MSGFKTWNRNNGGFISEEEEVEILLVIIIVIPYCNGLKHRQVVQII